MKVTKEFGTNKFELELVKHVPNYILLTTISVDEKLPTNCSWGFSLEEFQEFVDFTNSFNKGIQRWQQTN